MASHPLLVRQQSHSLHRILGALQRVPPATPELRERVWWPQGALEWLQLQKLVLESMARDPAHPTPHVISVQVPCNVLLTDRECMRMNLRWKMFL